MEANARRLEQIFDRMVQYQIPLFQRPYVWEEAKNWEPLWEDIEGLLNQQLRKGKVYPHFMGAVVLEQVAKPTGSIETRQVIDGQQRFTTLQLVLVACRDHATRLSSPKFSERFGDLASNRASKIDREEEAYKVWPTNSDRAAYRLVHDSGSHAALDARVKSDPVLRTSNMVEGYRYFYRQLEAWFGSAFEPDEGEAPREITQEARMEALWAVIKDGLQVVVIDLNSQDETQVIFETMNALGEPLLPADLIKNYLFRRAGAEGAVVEKLYEQFWAGFDQKSWRVSVKQGRTFRPLIDIFLNHYLSLVIKDDVRASHLFSTFKAYVERDKPAAPSLIPMPTTAAEHMEQLDRYAQIYLRFSNPSDHPRLATFLRRLEAVDTTTVYPFLLFAYGELVPERRDEFDRILGILESFLMRRMVCGLTAKNYNKLFIDLIKAVDRAGRVSVATVSAWLAAQQAESSRFPTDALFETAALIRPHYDVLAQYKVRAILEALDGYFQSSKSEVLPLPPGLTIEHVMPQGWEAHWPLPVEVLADPVLLQKAKIERDQIVHTLGNLTLITHSLNPALSNASWDVKRPELLKFAKLNLTRYFYEDAAATWDEDAIKARSLFLVRALLEIWPDVDRAPITETA